MSDIIRLTNQEYKLEYERIQYIKVDEKIFNHFKGKTFWNDNKTLCIYFFKYNPLKQIFLSDSKYYDDHTSNFGHIKHIYTLILKDDCIKNRISFRYIEDNYFEHNRDINVSIKKNILNKDLDKCDYMCLINDIKNNFDLFDSKLKMYRDLIKLLNDIKDKYSKETNDEKSFIEFGTSIEKSNINVNESIKNVKIYPKFFEMAFRNDNTTYQFRNIKFEKISQNNHKIIFTYNNIKKELSYFTYYYEFEFNKDDLKLLTLNEICNLYDDLSYFTNITNFEMELKYTHKYF